LPVSRVRIQTPEKIASTLAGTIADPTSDAGKAVASAISAKSLPGAVPPEITGTHPGGYDRSRNVYNLKPKHLFRTRAKLAASDLGLGLCKIAAVGDSKTAGDKATRVGMDSYPRVLRDMLVTRGHKLGGTGVVLAHYADSGSDTRWTRNTGSWTPFTVSGNRTTLLQASVASITFASDVAGTVAEVFYSNLSAPFTVAIDGAAAVTVTPAGGSTIGTYAVSGLANTTHSVLITAPGTIYLSGAQVRQTSGVLVSTLGLGGARATDVKALDVDYGLLRFTVNQVAPTLVLLDLMTNEAFTNVTVDVFKAAMQSIIGQLLPNSDVILVAAGVSSLNLVPFRIALYELADSNDLPIIDNYDRWGTLAAASSAGLMFTDNVHNTAQGYAEVARSIDNAMLL
jgi:hypothetical protein